MKSAYEQEREHTAINDLLAVPLVWTATPEDFLDLVHVSTYAANPNNLPLTSAEKAQGLKPATVDNMARAFMEVIDVNLAPYKDFSDLQKQRACYFNTAMPSPATADIADNCLPASVIHMPRHPATEETLLQWADAFISKTARYIHFDNILFSKIVLAMKLG